MNREIGAPEGAGQTQAIDAFLAEVFEWAQGFSKEPHIGEQSPNDPFLVSIGDRARLIGIRLHQNGWTNSHQRSDPSPQGKRVYG